MLEIFPLFRANSSKDEGAKLEGLKIAVLVPGPRDMPAELPKANGADRQRLGRIQQRRYRESENLQPAKEEAGFLFLGPRHMSEFCTH